MPKETTVAVQISAKSRDSVKSTSFVFIESYVAWSVDTIYRLYSPFKHFIQFFDKQITNNKQIIFIILVICKVNLQVVILDH